MDDLLSLTVKDTVKISKLTTLAMTANWRIVLSFHPKEWTIKYGEINPLIVHFHFYFEELIYQRWYSCESKIGNIYQFTAATCYTVLRQIFPYIIYEHRACILRQLMKIHVGKVWTFSIIFHVSWSSLISIIHWFIFFKF